jgi:hypothetical protein
MFNYRYNTGKGSNENVRSIITTIIINLEMEQKLSEKKQELLNFKQEKIGTPTYLSR